MIPLGPTISPVHLEMALLDAVLILTGYGDPTRVLCHPDQSETERLALANLANVIEDLGSPRIAVQVRALISDEARCHCADDRAHADPRCPGGTHPPAWADFLASNPDLTFEARAAAPVAEESS